MSNGRLIPPILDDRTWKDIVDEAKALIPKYAPEWTDHNPADIGITLIELFAWIVEGMIYRLNRVPEKNYIEFLNLLGITRTPATPASTNVTFAVSGPGSQLIPKGTQVSTPQSDSEDAVIFEIDNDLTALPINLTHCLVATKSTSAYPPYPYKNFSLPLISGPFEKSKITIPVDTHLGVYLGFDNLTSDIINISLTFTNKNPADSLQLLPYVFYSKDLFLEPVYIIEDTTQNFTKNGKIKIQVPSDWQALKVGDMRILDYHFLAPATPEDDIDIERFWIALGLVNNTTDDLSIFVNKVEFNSVDATNALTININETDGQAENLGVSNGKSFQIFNLQNTPLYNDLKSRDAYNHLKIQVREPTSDGTFGPWDDWKRVEDIPKGNVNNYICNPVTGEIIFGNYDSESGKGHGRVPLEGSEIRALTYRYVVGGVKGNVPPHTINVLRTSVPGIIAVDNIEAATGGSDWEAIDDTKQRAPALLKNRYRAVTVEDYEYLAKEASTEIKSACCLPPRLFTEYDDPPIGVDIGDPWTYGELNRGVGNVNVIIIPEAVLDDLTPMPSDELLKKVNDYLVDRRPVTSRLFVTYPRYVPIKVHINIKIWQKAIDIGLVSDLVHFEDEINEKMKRFLHPTAGGPESKGWLIGQDIAISSIFEFIKPNSNIGFISDLKVEALEPYYEPPERPPYLDSGPSVWLKLEDYEMICSADTHSISIEIET